MGNFRSNLSLSTAQRSTPVCPLRHNQPSWVLSFVKACRSVPTPEKSSYQNVAFSGRPLLQGRLHFQCQPRHCLGETGQFSSIVPVGIRFELTRECGVRFAEKARLASINRQAPKIEFSCKTALQFDSGGLNEVCVLRLACQLDLSPSGRSLAAATSPGNGT